MTEINLKKCPECGIHAIRIEDDMTLDDKVECNNCHMWFKLREIVRKNTRRKKQL